MYKKPNEKHKKLTGVQLVEAVKDAIYEVLEEELDARIVATKKSKVKKENRQRALRVKRLQEARKKIVSRRAVLKKLQEKKIRLKEAYRKLNNLEKRLA